MAELAGLMVGREVHLTATREAATPGERVLELKGVTLRRHGRDAIVRRATPRHDIITPEVHNALDDVTFHVAAGEIVGIAGVDGNGQSEVAAVITGLMQPDEGQVLVDGKVMNGRTPREIIAGGVAAVPEDRQSQGLILDFNVADNLVTKSVDAGTFARGPFLRTGAIAAHARRLIGLFDVRNATPATPVGSLSGGNQQKVVLGREMDSNPRVLIAAQPTRGLDVGATEYIHRALVEQRNAGAAILLISTELEEVLTLSDRILVMYEGRIVGEVPGDRANTQRIGLMMAGHHPEAESNSTAVRNEAA
jgi:simple sugar transport system ATP-binding protein